MTSWTEMCRTFNTPILIDRATCHDALELVLDVNICPDSAHRVPLCYQHVHGTPFSTLIKKFKNSSLLSTVSSGCSLGALSWRNQQES
uniref:Uncharacterized protein n=1 Tax=Sphaerodactylus townsendi TaxID=933632 RepID=A0ACB8EAA8_9SAUR